MKSASLNEQEVEKFSALADAWWDPAGKFKPLHQYNPVRVNYIMHHIRQHFSSKNQKPEGLSALDIGCGGGILSEALAAKGFKVTGIDASDKVIEIAKAHLKTSGQSVIYQNTLLEDMNGTFDIICCMEVLEHVDDIGDFLSHAAKRLKKNGLLFFSTINRTRKAQVMAIIGAEYILNLLPRGTHHYDKLVKPHEIQNALAPLKLEIQDLQGVSYNPFSGTMTPVASLDINYMGVATQKTS